MNKIIGIIILSILLLNNSCDKIVKHYYRIRIDNKSTRSIMVYGNYILPDTALSVQKPSSLKTIPPNDFGDISAYEFGDNTFERFKNEKLTIFILSTDVVKSYTWDTITSNYMILKRYEITENDLVNDGSLIYP